MSGFIANAPVSTASSNATVTNDGWFPDVVLGDLRDAVRLEGSVTDARLREATIAAIDSVNRELFEWQAQHHDLGRTALEQVPAPQIDGTSRLVALYRRAVYSTVKADLTERYRDVDTTGAGHRRADDLAPSIDEQRRNARWAISDILGRPRTTVELI